MKHRSWTLGLCLAALTACETPADPLDLAREDGEGVLGQWVHSGSFNRTYHLHTPPGMTAEGSYPLLILLHGAGGTGRSFHAILDPDRETDAGGFITVFPDGIEYTWTVGCGACTPAEIRGADDVTFLQVLVRHLAEGLPVDTTRVYVAGFSQGGQLAQLFACESDLPPAGIGSVGALLTLRVGQGCDPAGPLSVTFIHGDADPIMPYHGFGPFSELLSLSESVDFWVDHLGCATGPQEDQAPDRVGDGTTVLTHRYSDCANGGPVEVHTVEGGGHTWPGKTGPWPIFVGKHSRNLDTTRRMVDFFLGR